MRHVARGRMKVAALAGRAIASLVLAAGLLAAAAAPPGLRAETAAAPIPQSPRLRPLEMAAQATAIAALDPVRQAAIHDIVRGRDLAGLQAALRDGSLTSVELTVYYLSRIDRLDEGLRAFLEVNPAALAEAQAADAAFRAGVVASPLQGIPVSIKDNIETAGPMHTTANAAILRDNVAAADAVLVAQLRASGAVILGKNSLSEFAGVVSRGAPAGGAGAVGGQGMNPHGAFETAGSSSGGAIAVAAGLARLAVGSETSGSLIAPAAANGIVALKPSKGLVPGEGVIPLLLANDTAGPMAGRVAEAAALLAVIDNVDVDYTAGLSITALDGVTVGVLAAGIAGSDAQAAVLAPAVTALTVLGARLRPAEVADPTGLVAALPVVLAAGIRHDMMPYITARHPDIVTPGDLAAWNAQDPATRAPFGQDLLVLLDQIGTGMTRADLAEATGALSAAATEALDRAFAASGAEVLVSAANLHSEFYASAGLPAITVPLGLRPDGRPIGVTLIGRHGADARLLAFAHALEQATRARALPPVMAAP